MTPKRLERLTFGFGIRYSTTELRSHNVLSGIIYVYIPYCRQRISLAVALQPGALPSALDFGTFADAASWRTRSDTAQIVRTNVKAGLYYVGILNNAEDIQEAANYTLTVRSSQQGTICPWNCNANGNCASNGVCNCNAGNPLPSSFTQEISMCIQEWLISVL